MTEGHAGCAGGGTWHRWDRQDWPQAQLHRELHRETLLWMQPCSLCPEGLSTANTFWKLLSLGNAAPFSMGVSLTGLQFGFTPWWWGMEYKNIKIV